MRVNIFWFRRDLRLNDNAGLYQALKSGNPVLPIFIFDTHILNKLESSADARVEFIHQSLEDLQRQLSGLGSGLLVYRDTPENVFRRLLERYEIEKVFVNRDYEPFACHRDEAVKELLSGKGASFHDYKDHVLFEKDEVVKDDGQPYTVFTPYSRKWKSLISPAAFKSYSSEKLLAAFYKHDADRIPDLSSVGFAPANISFPPAIINPEILAAYDKQRDFPAAEGTSRLGIHLRFGTVSIRQLAGEAAGISDRFLDELVWRDFFHMILWHFPRLGTGSSFKPAYDHIEWRNDEEEFDRWCRGMTGYPLVDAGMRQLNETGFMHNRARMVTASFLTKHLLIDWRWGEAYFAEKLLDFDMAANNGGWQWAAGCGCDAAPWFRIFNPTLQAKKFDPEGEYVRSWVPEINEFTYSPPIVDHEMARRRCLEVYNKALKPRIKKV